MIELNTFGGRSKFSYKGSVKTGLTLFYGSGHTTSISSGKMTELLATFAGKTVKVGATRDKPLANSLQEFIVEYIQDRSLATYLAPVLIHEGYVERTTHKGYIRFY